MASILLTNLKKSIKADQDYTYKDINLDIQQVEQFISDNRAIQTIKHKDIADSKDVAAIINSIFNILNTRPGQRFLIPKFGCNLLGFVGQPITESTGNQLGQIIYNAIRNWEPRVRIDNILVDGRPDDNEYDITFTITIPSLKRTDIKLISVFTKNGILEADTQ